MGLERNRPILKKTCRIARYVYKNHNKYYVVYNKKNIAKYNTEEEAIKERDRLINEGKIIPQRRGRKPRCEEDRYIRRVKGKYTLQKSINGKTEYCDKCRKWLYTKHYNEYPSHNYEQYLHDECPQR